MKKHLLVLMAFCLSLTAFAQKTYQVASPDGNLKVTVKVADAVTYDVALNGETVLENGTLAMTVGDVQLGVKPRVTGKSVKSVNETITPVIPFKFSSIANNYNQLTLKFKGNYSVEFRAFNDGVAYRFVTALKGEVEVMDELFQVELPENYTMHVQQSDRTKTAYEEFYHHLTPEKWNENANKYTLLPVMIETPKYKVLISESDLTDYPCMMLNGKAGADMMTSVFPHDPIEFGPDGDRSLKLVKEADYIAKTQGARNFPWRYFVVATEDGQIIENTMTARLAPKSEIADPSWIKTGVTTWEWWNGNIPYGPEIDFEAGCNTETYKYYIDFASKFGIEYVLLDEGWGKSTRDPYTPNDKLDLKELIAYGKEKGVDVIVWLSWLTVENNFDLFEKYAEWGIKGVKIDFMDRSDQWMVDFYERVAKKAAEHKLIVDFHGSFKPAGLEYKYPNVLSYEGVRGMEQNQNCKPENSIWHPFMRNAVGPMDYTPGAMLNYQHNTLKAGRPNAGSAGTRAYQMALYVIFETGLQMMADNPTLYYREPDCAQFMADVPVETDETISLDSKLGEYVIVAKRKGDVWYIGGMTQNDEAERVFELTLDFLEDGRTYEMTSYVDGINANRQAMHYNKKQEQVKKGQKITVKMARNGGFAAVLK